ncbi:PLP-dependent transferase [Ramicandelaber brevisporus]|nr:PLP-dependent transferase [Ramicandelaber brevisporus]
MVFRKKTQASPLSASASSAAVATPAGGSSSSGLNGNSTLPVDAAVPSPARKVVRDEDVLERTPYHVLLTTYFAYLVLIIFAHMRDMLGKLFHPEDYAFLRETNGYAPLVSDFESLWSRRLYRRIRDTFNRPITGVAGAYVTLLERLSYDYNETFKLTGNTTRVLNLSSYNYLGFGQNEGPCTDAVEMAIKHNGLTNASPRLEAGMTALLREAEAQTARFMGTEDALVVSMGHATNSTTLPALVSKGCLIISDELNHNSLVAGSRLSGATIRVFKHNNCKHLEKVLRTAIAQGQPRTHRPWKKILVIVEGLYSMEGNMVDLPGILALKDKYKFYLFLDEAHSIGALGRRGRGVCDYFGIDPRRVDVLMGTFTKSFGSAGGYIAGSRAMIEHLRVYNLSMSYAESVSVPVLQQAISSMRIIGGDCAPALAADGRRRLASLAYNAVYFSKGLRQRGFMVMGTEDSPVVPMLLYHPPKIAAFSRFMLEKKIAVVVVSYPATPIVTARVRFCLSAAHTKEDMDYALEAIDEVGEKLMIKYDPGAAKEYA